MKAHIVQRSDTILSASSVKFIKGSLNRFENFYVSGILNKRDVGLFTVIDRKGYKLKYLSLKMALFIFHVFSEKNNVVGLTQF